MANPVTASPNVDAEWGSNVFFQVRKLDYFHDSISNLTATVS